MCSLALEMKRRYTIERLPPSKLDEDRPRPCVLV